MINRKFSHWVIILLLVAILSAFFALRSGNPKVASSTNLLLNGVNLDTPVAGIYQNWGLPEERLSAEDGEVLRWQDGKRCFIDREGKIVLLIGDTILSSEREILMKGASQAAVELALGIPTERKMGDKWSFYDLQGGSGLTIEFVDHKVYKFRLKSGPYKKAAEPHKIKL